MEEYRELNKPTTTTATEQQDVILYAWQTIVANFNAKMVDEKENFSQKPTQQSVDDEYNIYTSGALSARLTVGTLGFWTVRCLLFCYNIFSYHFLTDAWAHISNYILYCYGLFAHTGICCLLQKSLFTQCWDRHEKEE